jgi:PAS domain S-box-containing protein
VRSSVEIALNSKVSLTQGLRAHVATNPDISQQQFEQFAKQLVGDTPGIRGLTLLRGNVISNVYPLEGNETAIGFAPLDDPKQRNAIRAAIDSPRGKLTGPVMLRQGGRAFIDRVPVYVPRHSAEATGLQTNERQVSNHDTEQPPQARSGNSDATASPSEYWGLVSILIDYDQVVKEIRACPAQSIDVAICNDEEVENGSLASPLYGSRDLLEQAPLTATVALPTATWRLYGIPKGGWPEASPRARTGLTLGIIASSLLALIAFSLVRSTTGYLNSVAALESSNRQSLRIQKILSKTSRMARVGGWEFDIAREELTWSDEVCRIHDRPPGYRPSLSEAIEYYQPTAQKMVQDSVSGCLEKLETFEFELPLVTATGRRVWVRAWGEPEVIDGRCVRIWGTFQDVTELHDAQKQLQLTQYAVDHSADMVFFINQDGEVVYSNRQATQQLGFMASADRPLLAEIDPELTAEQWPQKWNEIKQKGHENYSSQLRRSNRDPITCDITMWFVDFEDHELVVATARDVTEARREAELRTVLFEQSTDAHLIFDESGIIECNQAAVEMLRMNSKAELLTSHPARFSPELQPDGQKSMLKCLEMDAIARKNGHHRFDWMHMRADGEVFPCEVTLNPVKLKSGPALLVVWHDISERKLAEQNLADSNRELQQFAYVASHDLQAPLRGIANFAQFLDEDYSDKLDDDARDYIARIVDGCKRMQMLINDLLSYCKVDGRSSPKETVNLQNVAAETLDMLQPMIADSGAEVQIGQLPTVIGDHSQLVQLLMNLVGNSIKYNDKPTPAVHVEFDAESCQFYVRDNGIGIAPEHHNKIFEIFRRLHSQEEYPGTGIGLAICRRIVEHHGGKIALESTAGEGCTFTFTLPVSAAALPQARGNEQELEEPCQP